MKVLHTLKNKCDRRNTYLFRLNKTKSVKQLLSFVTTNVSQFTFIIDLNSIHNQRFIYSIILNESDSLHNSRSTLKFNRETDTVEYGKEKKLSLILATVTYSILKLTPKYDNHIYILLSQLYSYIYQVLHDEYNVKTIEEINSFIESISSIFHP